VNLAVVTIGRESLLSTMAPLIAVSKGVKLEAVLTALDDMV
jgi:hypothetical protein